MILESLLDPNNLASLLLLTGLEIVLGIDNIVFIALIVSTLPAKTRDKARVIGISIALIFRVILLLGIAWIISLKQPLFSLYSISFSGRDLMLIIGGLFLIGKSTTSMHETILHAHAEIDVKRKATSFFSGILQIIIIDIIFSFDSIITAVGITYNIPVIVVAMVIAMLIMLCASKAISIFIERYPSLKILALSFILMIGMMLVADGFDVEIPRGYIYFGMGFSLLVETLNIIMVKKASQRKN